MALFKNTVDTPEAVDVMFSPSASIPASNVQEAIQYVWDNVSGGVSGTYAPIDAQYIVSASNATLDSERVLTDTDLITWDDGTLGQMKANWAHLGIESLTDPNADRGMFWDDSAGAMAWFTLSSGLSFVGTNLSITNQNLIDLRDASLTSQDLLYFDGANLVPLAKGSNYEFLRVNGSGNLEWLALPAGSGSGDMMSFNDLSDVSSVVNARSNLSVYSIAEVDALVTAQDLDFQGDSGGALSIDLDSEVLTIAGGTGIDTSGAANTLTIAIDSTVATLTGSQTLTNKTVNLTNNTLTGTQAEFDAACSDGNFVYTDDIGASVQAYDAGLADIAGLAVTDGNIIVGNGTNWVAESGATARASLGVTIGTHVQAYSANLDSWAAVNESAYYNSTEADSAIATALTAYTTTADLASTANGDGAALIGIEDVGAYFSGTNVESALQYLGSAVAALDQAVVLKGSWDASSGSFPGSGSAQAGWSYVVSVDGTVDSVAFTEGDRIVALTDNASTTTYAANWLKLDYTDRVSSVAGRTGAVTLAQADISGLTTSDSPQFTALNIGHASDTTITRVSAGVIAVEGSNVLLASNIGSTVQGYDANTAKYNDATANFTGTLQNGGSNVVVDSDIGSTVQGYDADLAAIAALTTNAAGRSVLTLNDPNADRLTFWDDSAGSMAHGTATNGIEISNTSVQMTSNQRTAEIVFVIDGGGSAITTGVKGYIEVPFNCTITQATALADQSGSIVVDVWKDTYANYPPTDADSITSAAPVTISTATKSQDSTLTGWTTSVSAGDILGFNVDSATTVELVTISLQVTKT